MILQIDMGNSRIKWRVKTQLASLASGYLPSDSDYSLLLQGIEPYKAQITRAFVASVQSVQQNQRLAASLLTQMGVECEFASSQPSCGDVVSGYETAQQLGVDRWSAIVAAYSQARQACVVVSAGTALTVDLVAANGRHLGGYIAPGLALHTSGLQLSTARIGAIGISSSIGLAPGRDTEACVRNAWLVMAVGLVNQALTLCGQAGEGMMPPQLFLTGGNAVHIEALYPGALIREHLVLDGLDYLFDPWSRKAGR